MKKRIIVVAAAAFAFAACEKDGEKIIVTPPEQPSAFSASSTDIVLKESEKDNLAVTFYWKLGELASLSDPTVSIPEGVVAAALQLSDTDTFAKHADVEVGSEASSVQLTVLQLNQQMIKLGFNDNVRHDIYARLAITLGRESIFSETLALRITPYSGESGMKIVSESDMENILGIIYAKTETPDVYEGFVCTPSTWYKCFFVAPDGVIWGCDENWTKYSLVPASSNNCWFAEPAGIHYVTADTKKYEWNQVYVPALTATLGDQTYELRYSSSAGAFKATLELAGSGSIAISGIGHKYDTTTGDSAYNEYPISISANADGSVGYIPGTSGASEISVSKTGSYILLVDVLNGKWELTANDEPAVQWPETMEAWYYFKGADQQLSLASVLSPTEDGIYEGFIYTDPDWGDNYSNFRFKNPQTGEIFGTTGSDNAFTLAETGGWNLWSNEPGLHYVVLDMSTLTWTETATTAVVVAGDFNGWSTSADIMTFDNGIWTATCEINNIGYGFQFVFGDSANGWRWKYGDSDMDGILVWGETVIPTVEGTYTLCLDLTNFAAPTYTMQKQ
ncbi:MAG: DUF5111 domain-containing protein [Candidatus Cryptobacteroides sp.]